MPAKKRINSSVKGKVAEREVVKILSSWWEKGTGQKDAFSRSPQSGAFSTFRKKKGLDTHQTEGDIVSPADCPLHLEIKRNENSDLDAALDPAPKNFLAQCWRQACLESPATKTPVLIFRRNQQAWRVAVPIKQGMAAPSEIPHMVLGKKFVEAAGLPATGPFVYVCLLSDFLENLDPAGIRGQRQALPAAAIRGDKAPKQLLAENPVQP